MISVVKKMKIQGSEFCINCMQLMNGSDVCQHCEYISENYNMLSKYLPPGTILYDRYVLGRVLGQGSFGITYIGRDMVLNNVVAVKEYFPMHHLHRNTGSTQDMNVKLYEDESQEEYEKMLGKFLNEAQCLSQFREVQGIVSVRDFFYANNTAYIVMEYVDGVSLKKYIDENGPMSGEWMLQHMVPILDALEQIHETGLIHRDISPDNIIVTPNKEAVLIDFGSARETNMNTDKSLTVVFKRGFSPEEQYRSRGVQGVWSDVYAMCATMYYCLTGTAPDEALERIFVDETPSLLSMKEIDLKRYQKKAIMKGISVRADKRYPGMKELKNELLKPKGSISSKWVFGGIFLVAFIIVFFIAGMKEHAKKEPVAKEIQSSSQKKTVTWQAVNASPAGVEAVISPTRPPQEKRYTIPNVVGKKYADVKELLKKRKCKVVIVKIENHRAKNTIVSQSVKAGKRVKEGTVLVLKVSKGMKVQATPQPTKKPAYQDLDGIIQ